MRIAVLREASLEDDRPSILRGEGGFPDEGIAWQVNAMIEGFLRHHV